MGALWAWGLCALVHPVWVSLVDGWVAVCPIGIQRGSTNGANIVAAHSLGATGCSAGQHVGQGQWCAMRASGMCTPWVVYRKQQVLGGCVGDKWRPSGGDTSTGSHSCHYRWWCYPCSRWWGGRRGQGSATGPHSHHGWIAQSRKCRGAVLGVSRVHQVLLPLVAPSVWPLCAQGAGQCCWLLWPHHGCCLPSSGC